MPGQGDEEAAVGPVVVGEDAAVSPQLPDGAEEASQRAGVVHLGDPERAAAQVQPGEADAVAMARDFFQDR